MFLFGGLILIGLSVFVRSELTAVVNTTYGPVQGEILTTVLNSVKYAAFKGIRYGKPPIGYLRFKPPIPADPWTEIQNATTEGPCCIQKKLTSEIVIGSEDCLFINVFTPVTDLEKAPEKLKSVMIWIYGGTWAFNSATTELFGPDFLLEKDIIFVDFNYRGGAFGFLSLDHPNATGNAGLKDQVLALKWVQANIERFGGNPHNVTIFGCSTGSMSVGYHVISDASVGLFHGAITESGQPLAPWAFQSISEALFHASELGRLLGTNSTDKAVLLETFYNASADDVVHATAFVGRRIISFTPTLENPSIATDVFLSKCSVFKYLTGNFSKVPQMIGYMEDEGVDFLSCRKKDSEEFLQVINYIMDLAAYMGMDVPESLSRALDTFDSWNSEEFGDFENTIMAATVKDISDFLTISQVDLTQKILAAYNGDKPVYYYHISFDMPRNLHDVQRNCTLPGAAHGDELAYLFHIGFANYTLDRESPHGITIYRMTTMWTNFAKYGDPTPHWVHDHPLNVTWPNSVQNGLSLEIGDNLTVVRRRASYNQNLIETLSLVLLPKYSECMQNGVNSDFVSMKDQFFRISTSGSRNLIGVDLKISSLVLLICYFF